MGVIPAEFDDLPLLLAECNIQSKQEDYSEYLIYLLNEGKVALNLIPLQNHCSPESLLVLQEAYYKKGILLIQLWSDVWMTKKRQVIDRVISLSGLNKRIHGRKTQLAIVDQLAADDFMRQYHIQGSAKSRYKYALKYEGETVAMATFSNTRLMTRQGSGYRSAELIRFATKAGITIVGGLTKLLSYYHTKHKVHDIMTYADRDWSDGKGYLSAGFVLTQIVDPITLWVDPITMLRYPTHRLPDDSSVNQIPFTRAFNTGNLKFILYLQNE